MIMIAINQGCEFNFGLVFVKCHGDEGDSENKIFNCNNMPDIKYR